jgi:hypothetical protein
MSLAICIKCGARKIGAWTPCPFCGFRAVDVEDLARAMLLTDQAQSKQALKAAAKEIKQGRFELDERLLDPIVRNLKQDDKLLAQVRNLKPRKLTTVWPGFPWLLILALLTLLIILWRSSQQ